LNETVFAILTALCSVVAGISSGVVGVKVAVARMEGAFHGMEKRLDERSCECSRKHERLDDRMRDLEQRIVLVEHQS
jgi:hypothetical protein